MANTKTRITDGGGYKKPKTDVNFDKTKTISTDTKATAQAEWKSFNKKPTNTEKVYTGGAIYDKAYYDTMVKRTKKGK